MPDLPDEYTLFTFLGRLAEAQDRKDKETIEAQKGYTLDGSPRGRHYNVTVWDDLGNTVGPPEPVVNEEGTGDHLQALRDLLKFLGED